MKLLRNLAIVSLLFIGLLILYMNMPEKDEQGSNSDAEKNKITIKTFKASDISEVNLKNNSGEVILKNKDNTWNMTSPASYKLDSFLVDSFFRNISKIEAKGIVDENPKDLGIYGLDYPQASLKIAQKKGEEMTFMLGDVLPVGGGYYLKTSEGNKVYYVDEPTAAYILRTASEFRDKNIISFDSNDLTNLIVAKSGKDIFKFVKEKDGWKVVSDGKTKQGDKTIIDSIVNKLSSLKANDFADTKIYKPSELGFDENSYSINFQFNDQKRSKIMIGKEIDDTSVYIREEESKEIFKITKTDVDFVFKDAKEFAQK